MNDTPCPAPDADGPYRYFAIGDTNAVRVTCDKTGFYIGAEANDPDNNGRLMYAHTLLSTIRNDELDVEEIRKQEFVDLMKQKARRPPPPAEM
jgi:hypothetical protein